MSYRKEKVLSLTGTEVNGLDRSALQEQCALHLNEKMHGICFSPYEGEQEPGDPISEEQIRRKLALLAPHAKWIRVFSCTEGNDQIPILAREYGFKTLVGAWLGDDKEKNEEEIQRLVELARDGYVDIAAVGNEVMYRKELEESELIDYIQRVKAALPNLPVGYVDAYYEFTNRPLITEACDVILIGTGTELELACKAGAELESKGKKVRVVSMPCWEAFERQPAAYQESVLPAAMRAKTVSIEAGTTFGWAKYAAASIGHDDFGASAPAPILYKEFGITADAMAAKAMSL